MTRQCTFAIWAQSAELPGRSPSKRMTLLGRGSVQFRQIPPLNSWRMDGNQGRYEGLMSKNTAIIERSGAALRRKWRPPWSWNSVVSAANLPRCGTAPMRGMTIPGNSGKRKQLQHGFFFTSRVEKSKRVSLLQEDGGSRTLQSQSEAWDCLWEVMKDRGQCHRILPEASKKVAAATKGNDRPAWCRLDENSLAPPPGVAGRRVLAPQDGLRAQGPKKE